MLADISVYVAKPETYAICSHYLLLFQALVDGIEQDLIHETTFTCYCAHVEKTKIDGFTTIGIKIKAHVHMTV